MTQISLEREQKLGSKVSRTVSVKSITSYKPIIKNINRLIARYSPILNADLNHNEYFRIKCVFAVYRKKRIPQINISTHVSSKIY